MGKTYAGLPRINKRTHASTVQKAFAAQQILEEIEQRAQGTARPSGEES